MCVYSDLKEDNFQERLKIKKYLTEKQVTELYASNNINLKEYHKLLHIVEENRNRINITKKKNQRSMSSTKWN